MNQDESILQCGCKTGKFNFRLQDWKHDVQISEMNCLISICKHQEDNSSANNRSRDTNLISFLDKVIHLSHGWKRVSTEAVLSQSRGAFKDRSRMVPLAFLSLADSWRR